MIRIVFFFAVFLTASVQFVQKTNAKDMKKGKKYSLVMKQSKEDFLKIVNGFKDEEGALIRQIRLVKKDNYDVEVLTRLKKCLSYRYKFTGKPRVMSVGEVQTCGKK